MAGDNFRIKSDSPVVDDLLFWRVVGHETLSRPSQYELTVLSKNGNIEAKDIIGRSFDVIVDFKDKADKEHERHCQGYAVRFARAGEIGRYFQYQISLQSWFGLLTRRVNSRILQEKNSQTIFNDVVDDSPIKRIKKFEPKNYQSEKIHRYCVQFQESDYSFLSRIMEEEGVYYWFDSHEQAGTMYASTASDLAHQELPATNILKYVPSGVSDQRFNEITKWTQSSRFRSGQYASRDSDFKAIKQKLKADKPNPASYELSDLEIFEFQGDYFKDDKTDEIATMRMEEISNREKRFWAHTSWPDVAVGHSFSYEGDPNESGDGDYLVASCSFVMSHPGYESLQVNEERIPISRVLDGALADDAVNADFQRELLAQIDGNSQLQTGITGSRAFLITVLPSEKSYRVPRLTPRVTMPGPQSAIVVGPEGEEIHTDDFGRVKVHFHWDRKDESNEKSTAYIRVNQPWAGKGWGGYFIPRIGQEVIVDFLNGDPDRPIVMGRVYNDDQPIPYQSPTQSGFKTRSTPKGSSSNYNEIMFEDKKGSENLNIHAEKNMSRSVENDDSSSVGHDQSDSVTRDRKSFVGRNEKNTVAEKQDNVVGISQTNSVGAGGQITHVAGLQQTYLHAGQIVGIKGTESHSVTSNQDTAVGGFQTIVVAMNQDVAVAGYQTNKVGADSALIVTGNTKIQTGGERNDVTSGKHSLMANEIKVISNTNIQTMAVGNIDATSIGSNTTVLGSNSSGYIGSNSEANLGATRSTFLGLSLENSLGLSASNTVGIQIENALALKLIGVGAAEIACATLRNEQSAMHTIMPGGGAGSASSAAVAGVVGGFAALAGLVSAIVDVGATFDQYSGAAKQLEAAAAEAQAQGLNGLADRLTQMRNVANSRVSEGKVIAALAVAAPVIGITAGVLAVPGLGLATAAAGTVGLSGLTGAAGMLTSDGGAQALTNDAPSASGSRPQTPAAPAEAPMPSMPDMPPPYSPPHSH